ncbi:cytochrome c oxidase assembly factor Coa1 family protein [Roseimaritima ulvae]|uniref:Cytochrome oxidase complex assembly protein 1 n=1 Tax=Roseimaritima ulvae TaxID=980254 RepID=A0A5B9QZH1_9BACT|nr:cytochrome c oxidase assembly factor Coa1 family protein [Roseimaritima ulvae]QEG43290.1 Cytochrome oxidase complex assembly protein 1 [Roseimaritima ulvae]
MATINDNDVPLATPQPQTPQKSNGKLFVFLGLGCLLPILACGGCIGLVFFGVTTTIKSSEPYTASLEAIQNDEGMKATLGTPIEGGMPMGNINLNNNDGEADITYTATGPNGAVQVHVVGTKTAGVWEYSEMTATARGETISLLPEDNEPPAPAEE